MNDFETGVCVGYLLHKGDGSSIILDTFSTAQNGHWTAQSGHAWNDITVNVPGSTTITSLSVNANGTYTAPANTAYTPVTVNVPQPTLTTLNANENRTYTAPANTAYNPVNVNVPTYEEEYREMVVCSQEVIARLQKYDPDFDPTTCEDIPDEVDEVAGYEFPDGTPYSPTILDAVGTDPITDVQTGQTLYCAFHTQAESIGGMQGAEAWYTDSAGNVYLINGDYDGDPTVYYTNCRISMVDSTTGTVRLRWSKRTTQDPSWGYDADFTQVVPELIGYGASGHTYKVHNN